MSRTLDSFFDRESDPNTVLQEMSADDVLEAIGRARESVCSKTKTIEIEVQAKKDANKAAGDNIKVLKEEQSFYLGRLTAAEEGLRRKA